MTAATLPASEPSAWSWWEARRLRYNIGLFVAGWAGCGLQVAALMLWARPAPDLVYMALWQGLIYVLYMAAANVAFLLGPTLEAMLKPRPVESYRAQALRLGSILAMGLPVLVAGIFAVAIGWSANVG